MSTKGSAKKERKEKTDKPEEEKMIKKEEEEKEDVKKDQKTDPRRNVEERFLRYDKGRSVEDINMTIQEKLDMSNEETTYGIGVDSPLKWIANQKNEPKFQLKLWPAFLKFDYIVPQNISDTINIENTSSKRQAFKIKSTSNAIYRAYPTVGFIEPNEVVHIRVTYFARSQRPPPIFYHVVAYHAPANPNARSYAEAFEKGPAGVAHLWCVHRCNGKCLNDEEQMQVNILQAKIEKEKEEKKEREEREKKEKEKKEKLLKESGTGKK